MAQRISTHEDLEDPVIVRGMKRRITRQVREQQALDGRDHIYCIQRRALSPDPQFPQVAVDRWYVIARGTRSECDREVVQLRRDDARRFGPTARVEYKVRPYNQERLDLPLLTLTDCPLEPNLAVGTRVGDAWTED